MSEYIASFEYICSSQKSRKSSNPGFWNITRRFTCYLFWRLALRLSRRNLPGAILVIVARWGPSNDLHFSWFSGSVISFGTWKRCQQNIANQNLKPAFVRLQKRNLHLILFVLYHEVYPVYAQGKSRPVSIETLLLIPYFC